MLGITERLIPAHLTKLDEKECYSSHLSMGFPRDFPRATPSANPYAIPGSDEKSIKLRWDQRHCFQTSCLSSKIHCQTTNISLYLFKAA